MGNDNGGLQNYMLVGSFSDSVITGGSTHANIEEGGLAFQESTFEAGLDYIERFCLTLDYAIRTFRCEYQLSIVNYRKHCRYVLSENAQKILITHPSDPVTPLWACVLCVALESAGLSDIQ